MSEKRWTKQEFLDIVDPCGYGFRIWWWFLWHRYVTVLNLATVYVTSNIDRLWAIRCLDFDIYIAHLGDSHIFFSSLGNKNDEETAKIVVRSIRKELRNKE